MLKHIFTLASALLLTLSAWAIPAKRITRVLTQPDGTKVTVVLSGDESFHCLRTTDGLPVVKSTDGTWCYATLSGTNLIPTSVAAHDVDQRSESETAFLKSASAVNDQLTTLHRQRIAARNERRKRRLPAVKALASTDSVAHRRGLVILVNFQDQKMHADNTREEFDKMMNQTGYDGNGNAGSVHDYFLAQSYGKFDLTFDVVGPVTVSKNLAAYGAKKDGNDIDPAGMVYEACKLVADKVNFKDYDWDGDGEVDQVFIIFAGNSEAEGGDENCIWPHEWDITYGGYSLTLNGVKIGTYGCASELYGTSKSRMGGIGTACHEFSHCMGLPDMYDVDYSGGFGMGCWSLMDSGSYNGDGYAPSGYTAYERWTSGWLQPVELKKACTVTGIPSLDKEPVAYVVYNDANRNEYYLIENRQQDGWFAEDEAKGLMVTHVDFDEDAWWNNTVNDIPGHQRCAIVPADNKADDYSYSGDLYPYKGNNQLTNTSSPAASLFNPNTDGTKFLSKPITHMSYGADGLASFAFMGGLSLDIPAELSTEETSANGFTARWGAVDKAETYSLELRPDQSGQQDLTELCMEDFNEWSKDQTGEKDSNIDISSKLDNYSASTGWTGTKLFLGPSRLKLGTSSVSGSLVSPVLAAPATEKVSVKFTEKRYSRDVNKVLVELRNAYGTVQQSREVTPSDTEHVVVFENVNDDFRVSISTTAKRVYLTGQLLVCDGEMELSGESAARTAVLAEPSADNTVQVVKGLTDLHHTFDALPTNAVYKWRVRSESGSVTSPWSAWQRVVLGTVEGINQAVSPATGWNAATEVEVFSLSGRSLRRAPLGYWSQGLPAGTYLLRNGKQTELRMK